MIHPSMQPGFHPNAGFWILLAIAVIYTATRVLKGRK
jgi:hypothetical protein